MKKMKRIKVTLTKDEVGILINDLLGGWFTQSSDNGVDDDNPTKEYKQMSALEKKILKAFNKTGTYYLWQLKDRCAGVTPENIKDEYK